MSLNEREAAALSVVRAIAAQIDRQSIEEERVALTRASGGQSATALEKTKYYYLPYAKKLGWEPMVSPRTFCSFCFFKN
jgi:hypothetical protein